MTLHFFDVPVLNPEPAQTELNRFLNGHRVLTVDRRLIDDGPNSRWAICVTTMPKPKSTPSHSSGSKRPRVDYRNVLPEAQFEVFAELRTLRKEIAEREKVPLYALFSNEQLAEMVTRSVRTLEELKAIPGIGPARRDTYGAAFLARLKDLIGEAS